MNIIKWKSILVLALILTFANNIEAESLQLGDTGFMQSTPFPFEEMQQKATLQRLQFQERQQLESEQLEQKAEQLRKPQAQQQQPSIEKPSGFEQYLSEKIEITDLQFEILKKYRGLIFSYEPRSVFAGQIVVPIRIVKYPEKSQGPSTEVEAGFLIGPAEVITDAFKLLGIKSLLSVSTEIKHFGYDLFRHPPSTFAPSDKVPVGPDYVLGPGDEIRITAWGKFDGRWNVVVDRDGNLTLPKVGVIGVTGLTFKELKELLFREFSKYYTGFEMNVSMGALRTLRVYVVGNAEKPGAYTVSSLSTFINALFESGGPSKTGTMRDMQLKRNGKAVVHLDLYDFLLKGDKSRDVRLLPEDVIFIPPIGSLGAIAGSVNTPAIYELKGETTVSQLLEMAGGLNTIAFKDRVQIERIADGVKQVVFESDIEGAKDIKVNPGDLIKIFPVFQDKRVVRIRGAVQRESEYGFKPGMTVKDLVSVSGGLKYYAYDKEAELTRVTLTDKGPQTEKFIINIKKALERDPANNIFLKENDYLFVRTIPEWQLYRKVTIYGELKFPGIYPIKKGERLSSIIERAGGFTNKAYLKGAIFTRESVRWLQQKQLDDAVDRLEQRMLSQAALSTQTAISAEEAAQHKAVAEQQKAVIAKMRAAKAQGRMVMRLDDVDRFKGSIYDIELEDGDSLVVPEKPNSIQVIGSVYNSTAFVYLPNGTLSDYIDKAGGATAFADANEIFVLKIDGSAVSRRQSGMFFMSSRLDPGDTVVVPEKVERIAWMREIKDLTQILYQIAVTAGVLIRVL